MFRLLRCLIVYISTDEYRLFFQVKKFLHYNKKEGRLMNKPILFLLSFLIIGCSGKKYTIEKNEPPASQAAVFMPGLISNGMNNRDITMTPDGKEIYYCASFGNFSHSKILVVKQSSDGSWSEPEIASFCSSSDYIDIEPFIQPDGKKLYFMSTRPDKKSGEMKGGDQDIWVVDRKGDSWGAPYNLGEPVSSENEEYFPTLTTDGTIYFTRQKKNDPLGVIYRARLENGKYRKVEKLPAKVNCGQNRYNAFVAPDESFVIVPAEYSEKTLGGVDYFITFRNENDEWSDPVNMGEPVSSKSVREWSASLSPDGNYIFFMSDRAKNKTTVTNYSDFKKLYNSPGNGFTDIYWTGSEIIEDLRPEGF